MSTRTPLTSILCWDGSHENVPAQWRGAKRCKANVMIVGEYFNDFGGYVKIPKAEQTVCQCSCHEKAKARQEAKAQ